jgi:hypothetical protein
LAREQGKALAMVKHHGEGNATDPVGMSEYNEIVHALSGEKEEVKTTLIGIARDMVSRPGNRRRLLIIVWAAI